MTIVLIFIDLEIQILPDIIDLPGTAIGIAIAAFSLAPIDSDLALAETLAESVIGAISGAGILLAIAGTYKLLRHVEGMGLGDVKMMAMIGSVVGWRWLFAVLMVASIWGALAGVALAVRSRAGLKTPLPFGVFLGLSMLAILFFGDILLLWLPTLRWGA
jgi:leader peptidase (prepilin peptidase)/N-methyltransferase